MELCISAFGPSITEQCVAAGAAPTGMSMEMVERVSKAITLCLFQGVLTEAETDKARRRMIKNAKFQAVGSPVKQQEQPAASPTEAK